MDYDKVPIKQLYKYAAVINRLYLHNVKNLTREQIIALIKLFPIPTKSEVEIIKSGKPSKTTESEDYDF